MFRLITFLLGLVAGFAAAIFVLPLPGKTFFNRMSKLPPNAQNLIDNGINLMISVFRVSQTGMREFNHHANNVLAQTKEKVEEINKRFKEARTGKVASSNGSKQADKEKVAA